MRKYKILFVLVFAMFIIIPFDVSAMKIFIIKPSFETITLEVESGDTIEAIKQKIQDKEGIPHEKQQLFFEDIELILGRTLEDYEIQKGNTLHLLLVGHENKIKVIFEANGGTFKDSDKYIIENWKNEEYDNLILPTREGYEFRGYYTEKIGGTKFEMILNESGIDSDMTFYAQWDEVASSGQGEAIVENPNTFDGITSSILTVFISLIGLVGIIIYSKKRNKVGA